MERGLKAAFLLSLIVVAAADRALLNKPAGGALHAVGFAASYYDATASAVVETNYFITNGNGSWTYSPYSTTSNAAYASINSAFSAAGLNGGSIPAAAALTTSYQNMAQGLTAITFPSKNLGIAVGAAAEPAGTATTATPSILITLDGALTWMAVTGVPNYDITTSTAGSATAWPIPVGNAPDLTSVFFASKSLGWAAGGLISVASGLTYGGAAAAIATGTDYSSQGTILMTTNGGTVWTNCPVNPSNAQANVAPIAGALTSIMSDSAGKNVYAVGAPGTLVTGSPTWTQAATTTFNAQQLSFGTILYSANSGASWVTQTAPAVSGWDYGFMSVYVQKGTTAWAVGGNVGTPSTAATSFGVIVGTTNGGFSWTLQSYQGVATGKAPAFTTVTFNGKTGWVGGFISDGYYPAKPSGAVVTGTTLTVPGTLYTLLTSTDGKTWTPVAPSSLPAGFVATGSDTATVPTSTKHVFGITWDNANRGFIYGTGFIMSTQNGGSNWVYETPNDLATTDLTTGAGNVVAIANVPTSY